MRMFCVKVRVALRSASASALAATRPAEIALRLSGVAGLFSLFR